MAVSTDRLDLNKLGVFKLLREKLPTVNLEKRNIIDCRDGIIFMWLSEDRVLLTLNLKHLGAGNDHQVLKPVDISQVLHNIQELQINNSSSQIAAISTSAVTVFDLPLRWGKEGNFIGGASEVLMRCNLLKVNGDSYIDLNKIQRQVLKVSWYPDRTARPYLAVLYSDNCLRIYDTTSIRMVQSVQLGRLPSRINLTVLGDMAVDFDFCPFRIIKDENKPPGGSAAEKPKNFQWQVYILKCNGDIYTFDVNLTKRAPKFQVLEGPLPMSPQEVDNYMIEASSILVLNCYPPIVVVATTSGWIYHCLHLIKPNPSPEIDNEESVWCEGTLCKPTNYMLYVIEKIKLLDQETDKDSDSLFNNNINLMIDRTSPSRYICFHYAGVHVVRVPVVHALASLNNIKKEDEAAMCSTLRQATSSVDYIVCTHMNSLSSLPSPVLGIRMLSPPDTLITILGDGQAISVLVPNTVLSSEFAHEEVHPTNVNHQPFINYIENILRQSKIRNLPILKLPPNLNIEEYHNCQMNRLSKYRDALAVYQIVSDEIKKRSQVLSHIKERQREELDVINVEKTKLRSTSEKLAERIVEMYEKQIEFTKKAENLLMKSHSLDFATSLEKKMCADLKEKHVLVIQIMNRVTLVKKRLSYFKNQKEQMEFQDQRAAIFLTSSQSSSIRKSMIELKTAIIDLVRQVIIMKMQIEDGVK